ncbi:MAG: sulfatase, partial [Armatimonadetes bacterium]|nr:sulfatase [Armatimonadota bacterium]
MRHGITRREAVHRLATAGAALALPAVSRAQPPRPNVVVILVDDLRWDAFSHLGHPFLQTPHIDRLAREGARFENAFVVISLCSPSRACFLTGCHPQRTGVFGNEAQELDPRVPTYPQVLQSAGYETGYIGKWHMVPNAAPRPGFDYWLSFSGQGVYENPELNENGQGFRQEGYLTDILTDRATAWVRRERTRPFCLCLAHKAVHGPFTPAERHRGALAETALPKPPSFDEDFADKPVWLREQMVRGTRREEWERNRDRPIPDKFPPAPWDAQRGRDYFRTLLAVDDSVGAVLRALEESGQLDHTMVVFTSDNGYFQGEFRRGDKRLAYEASIRIPLLVRYPPLVPPGAVVASLALNVDLCPTLLDLCAASAPAMLAGRSLLPVLRQPDTTPAGWRQDFLYQYFQERAFIGIPDIQAVRTSRWKYIRAPRHAGSDELYDLAADPHELNNLAREGDHAATLR